MGSGLQCRFVERFEDTRPAAIPLAEGPVVEPLEQLANRLVGFRQREELAVPQCRHDPALGHLHGIFHDRLVPRLVRPRRHHAEAIVHGEVVISRVDIRIVAVSFAHACLGVVGDDQRRNAAPIIESVDVRAQPRLPSAGRAWLRPRCRNWRRARRRTATPATPHRCRGRRWESSSRPSRRKPSRRPCVPAASPRRASCASAGTVRRSGCSR